MALSPVAARGEAPALPDAEVAPEADADRGESARDDLARHRAYTLGTLMLAGIVIAGVGLVALVLVWGGRTRRIARQPLPRVAPRDELWYLKAKRDNPPPLDEGDNADDEDDDIDSRPPSDRPA